jgi:hypothetical protein
MLAVFLYLGCNSVIAAPDKHNEDACRSAFEENPKARDPAKSTPLVMAIFGDSIMWGQGLKERDKFWCRTKQWLELKTGREVKHHPYAHAGAVIEEESLLSQPLGKDSYEFVLKVTEEGKEVNVSFPTIIQQVDTAAKQFEERSEKVDLVLVDGCINDLNLRTLLNAGKTEEEIETQTVTFCHNPMDRLLRRINEKFPNAYVVVTGYYPLVYKGVPIEKNRKTEYKNGTAKNRLTEYLVKILGKNPTCANPEEDTFVCLDRLSRAWHEASNKALKDAVKEVNASIGVDKELMHFAELHFPPEYGFSTKQTMLWNIRFGATNAGGLRKVVAVMLDVFRALDTNDDTWDLREKQCGASEEKLNKRLRQLSDPVQKKTVKDQLQWFESICKRGSLAHPNKFGAALYAQSIIGRLDSILAKTRWLEPDGVK